MTNQTSTAVDGIPKSVKIFTWVLICAGLFFAYACSFNPGLGFPGAKITDDSSQFGFASTGVRVLGSVAALLISVAYNKPQWLLITLISRLVIEVGDIIVGIATGGTLVNNIMIGVIAALELWAILKLAKIGQQCLLCGKTENRVMRVPIRGKATVPGDSLGPGAENPSTKNHAPLLAFTWTGNSPRLALR